MFTLDCTNGSDDRGLVSLQTVFRLPQVLIIDTKLCWPYVNAARLAVVERRVLSMPHMEILRFVMRSP